MSAIAQKKFSINSKLIEFPGSLKGLGLLKLCSTWYTQSFWQDFCMLFFFSNSSLMQFQFKLSGFFLQFSVIDQIEWCKVLSQQATFNFEFWLISFPILLLLFLKITHLGIYPSSFTNVRFWTEIEFSNVAKCGWGSQGTASSEVGSWPNPGGSWGSKAPESTGHQNCLNKSLLLLSVLVWEDWTLLIYRSSNAHVIKNHLKVWTSKTNKFSSITLKIYWLRMCETIS